ncbi:hypothetical protein HRbin15_02114 [bacterium HR15]|nr:hypothetical protein HRbin15_02114 [bacterium HR15]
MKRLGLLACISCIWVSLALTARSGAQPAPQGEMRPYTLDTDWVTAANASEPQKVFEAVIYYEKARSMRLYFAEVHLSPKSWIEVRSLYDNEVQRLNPDQLTLWHNTTAFFNGNAVLLSIYCEPNTKARVVIHKIWVDLGKTSGITPASCTECGGSTCGGCSQRAPACEPWTDCNFLHGNCHQWAARLRPVGCSASVISRASCVISAGHCLAIPGDPTDLVIQFNVPASLGCAAQDPPVADQFPIVQQVYAYDYRDWAVLVPGPNSEGQLPYERYRQIRRPVPYMDVVSGQPVAVYGYGRWADPNSTCRNYTLQYDTGEVLSAGDGGISLADMEVDAGNSGSGILRISDQRLIGVVNFCGGNGTLTSYWEFVRARRMLCPTPGDINENGVVDDADLLAVLFAFGQECPLFCIEDQNDDGIVDDADLLIVLFNFGNEY